MTKLHVQPDLMKTIALSSTHWLIRSGFILGVVQLFLLVCAASANASPAWSGEGRFRILVRVSPITGLTKSDELVAKCELPLESWLQQRKMHGSVDIATFQVHQYNPISGRPVKGVAFEAARSVYDRPCRFEDDYPARYASRVGRASETEDRPASVIRDREARLFNREQSTAQGRLVWSHRQDGSEASHYAIYFDVSPEKKPWGISPAPWIGDGDVLRQKDGESLGGFSHFTASVGDLTGDGLFDIVAGNEKGDMLWFPNRGKANNPKFVGCQILEDESGPIDTGWYAAPFVCDWNTDGLADVLVGTSGNVIVWWRNVGDRVSPRFTYSGFVQADGKRLEVPEAPVAEDAHGIFARDYYNQPWAGDVNGDGVLDLVTGGYTTGRIFWYRGQSRGADGTPELRYAGTINDKTGPIDTVWAAAPALADFDDDGRLDLVTGSWFWSGIQRAPKSGEEDVLWYFRGIDNEMRCARMPFPAVGDFPSASIARPNVLDCNGDGLLDLFVSESGGNAYIFFNVGSKKSPQWNLRAAPLEVPWGFTRDFDAASLTADVNGDEAPEILVGNKLTTVSGSAASPRIKPLGVAHVGGKPIDHPGPGYGDPYYFSILHDWDDDSHADVLWGTHQGNIYLHRSLASADPLEFAEGIELRLIGGEPLHVGPDVVESEKEATDFTILQGSRIVLNVADFDVDGINDLLVGDTFSNVWAFRGSKKGVTDAFHAGVLLTKLPTRPEAITCTDWNGDQRPDLLIGGTADNPCLIYYNASRPGEPELETGKPVAGLPYLYWGPKLGAADWNGDGDIDLLVQSEFFSFWLERSFLDHGYQVAAVQEPSDDAPVIEERSSVERSR
jgi:FG-GAP-like repeat